MSKAKEQPWGSLHSTHSGLEAGWCNNCKAEGVGYHPAWAAMGVDRRERNPTTYAIEALHRDEGTIVVFEGWAVGGRDSTAYLIAVDHRMAQAIAEALEGGEPVIVEAEGWQVVGTVR